MIIDFNIDDICLHSAILLVQTIDTFVDHEVRPLVAHIACPFDTHHDVTDIGQHCVRCCGHGPTADRRAGLVPLVPCPRQTVIFIVESRLIVWSSTRVYRARSGTGVVA